MTISGKNNIYTTDMLEDKEYYGNWIRTANQSDQNLICVSK